MSLNTGTELCMQAFRAVQDADYDFRGPDGKAAPPNPDEGMVLMPQALDTAVRLSSSAAVHQ